MRFLRLVGSVVFLLIMVSVAVAWVETGGASGLFFGPSTGQPTLPLRESVLAGVIMILGVYSGCVHSQLRDTRSPINIIEVLAEAGRRRDFWRALFVSPILFLAVYSSLEEQPDLVLGLLFSFENGFFCDKVLERRERHG